MPREQTGERRIDVVDRAEFCRNYGITLSKLLANAGIE
jgi:hypothetical protein